MFKILDAADPAQYYQWTEHWSLLKDKNAYAHPEYANAMKRDCDSALCFLMETVQGTVVWPMILRSLSVEPWADKSNIYRDIVTPYGFGGPYTIGFPDIAVFWQNLIQWAETNHVVCGFFRLSPFSANIKPFVDEVEVRGGNVIRSLSEGRESVWRDYKKTVRHDVRRAERLGLTIEVDEKGKRISDFLRLYYDTMQRRNALPQYFFSEQFFYNLFSKISGSSILFHVIYKNLVISSDLVLAAGDTLYSFLGGSDERFTTQNSGELLTHGIITWGIDNGKKKCVLGGGYDGYDGIFQFKKKFAPNGIIPFEVGKQIFNSPIYTNLCEKRRHYENRQGRDWMNDPSYFPSYRSKYDQSLEAKTVGGRNKCLWNEKSTLLKLRESFQAL